MLNVNEVELATVLAEDAMKRELLNNSNIYVDEDDLIEVDEDDEDITVYKPHVQKVFDRWYDYFYSQITEL